MSMIRQARQTGAVQASTLIIVGLVIVLLGVGGVAIWAYMQYTEARTDVDGQIALAVSEAEKVQAELDEEKFLEREKEPNRQFVGPNDYGRVTFEYPKTWSVYVDDDAADGGDFYAYLNPILVPPVDNREERYALRVAIEDEVYEEVLSDYESRVEDGELKTTNVSVNGVNGTRIDGSFSDEIRGSAVVFKLRDKTVTIQTDAQTFKSDFDKLIKTIEFNQ